MKNNTKNKLNNNIITIKIILHAYDNLFLNKFILNLKNKFKINFIKSFTSVNLPIKIKKYTVLSSPHVNKKAREQFETRFYKSIITIKTTKN
jgi:small subunit ribosomal protein S10